MVSTLALVRLLAALPAVCLAASVGPRGPKGPKGEDFDPSDLTYREVGARNTIDWRVWLEKDGHPISFWHDIPLYPDAEDKSVIYYYTEIPRWTDAKLETKRDEPLNPIFHDDKKEQPRFVYSVWPHKTYPFNYGSIPQTWEDPNHDHDFTGFPGDNDPVDIFEISSFKYVPYHLAVRSLLTSGRPSFVGEVKKVKILGGLAMIDDESTDWKIVAIDVEDPLAEHISFIKGDGTNTIIGDDYQNATFAQQIVEESHGYWKNLQKGNSDPNEIELHQTSTKQFRDTYIESKKATKAFKIPKKSEVLPPKPKPEEFDKWYYLDEEFNMVELPNN
ncbi:Inorganic pyrophosphatase-like protein [Hapsidospora chrysogenum ATCC 11550]|uniref:inorganic diphosphatase n=1 Tax=Hapsidospora chrysogenum (strain ATCC 11550 / CBS 779.69 / DSM 880 / IAM 14645 / JCM 23072 / IMI 49137) TaxID=857340 RepID=A0A086T096_HAPC1|nr:Inorganic pyrophosphatase-like protein [Hapsidospora chrysogenum ATCC 11550]